MAQSNTSRKILRYVKQTWGFADSIPTGASAPKLKNYRSTDWTMSAGKTSQQSEELRADRMPADSVLVGQQGSAQVSIEWSFATHNDFLEGICGSSFTTPVSTSASASAAASGNNWDVTVTSSANFAVGQYVRTSGFTTSPTANNGVFPILAIPNGTTLRLKNPAGTSTTAQTATVTSSSMLRMGTNQTLFLLEGEYSDINAFQRLESARPTQISLSAATEQRLTGQVQFLGRRVVAPAPVDVQGAGTAGNLQFSAGPPGTITGPANTWTGGSVTFAVGDFVKVTGATNNANNGLYKVSAVTSTVLTITNVDGSAKTFTAENNSRALVQKYQTVGDAQPTAATTTSIMNASTNIGVLQEGDQTLAAAVSGFEMTINGNLQPVKQIGSSALAGITDGTFAVTGTITAYYENNTLYNKLLTDAETSFSMQLTDAAGSIIFITLPRLKFTQGDPGGGGQNTLIPLPLQYTALVDATTNTLVQFDVF